MNYVSIPDNTSAKVIDISLMLQYYPITKPPYNNRVAYVVGMSVRTVRMV